MSDIDAFRAKCEEDVFTLMSHTSTPQGSRTGTSFEREATYDVLKCQILCSLIGVKEGEQQAKNTERV